MSNSASKSLIPTRRQLAIFLIASPLCLLLNEYMKVAPWGSWDLDMVLFPVHLALIAAFLAAVTLPFLFFTKALRQRTFHWWLYALAYLLLSLGALLIGDKLRHRAFAQLATRSAPLVDAVHQYIAKHGAPPPTLGALVPEFLPSIPKTGIGSYPDYELKVGPDAEHYAKNPWVLTVFTPNGFPSFDEFMYYPLQNYPTHDGRGSLQRIGDWAYLHE